MKRTGLMTIDDLQALSCTSLDAQTHHDMVHVFNALVPALGGRQGISTLNLAIIEPKVFEHHVKTLRILPRGVEHPKDGDQLRQDPGPAGDNAGAPWRPLNASERSCILLLYIDARMEVGLNPILDAFGNAPVAGNPGAAPMDGATKALLEQLSKRFALEEVPRIKPQDWGDVPSDDRIPMLDTDVYDKYFAAYTDKKGVEPPMDCRPVLQQITVFLKKMFPTNVDPLIAKAKDAHFPALDLGKFQPLPTSSKRNRVDKLEPQADGTWVKTNWKGVPDFGTLERGLQLFHVCAEMTNTISDGPLYSYLGKLRHFNTLYPDCFGYIELAARGIVAGCCH